MATKAHLEGNKRYLASKVDEIKLRVPKGRKAELQEIVDFLRDPAKYRRIGARIPKGVLEIAQQSGDSLNAFIIKAIDAYINRAEE